jgi:transposase-like protein
VRNLAEGVLARCYPSEMSIDTLPCPYCKLATHIPGGFDSIDVGRFNCQHCFEEFLVIDGIPMTQEQYRQRNKVQ